jgi:hypothetical protein
MKLLTARKGDMNRYSTITIEIESEFDLEHMADVWVTFEQGKNRITKKKSLKEINCNGNIARVTLSQEETAGFKAFMPISVQARWISDEKVADSSAIEYFSLGDVLEEGEISV